MASSNSHYSFLGGNSNYDNDQMKENIIDKVLGKNYDTYIMFETKEYNSIKNKYAKDTSNWEMLWKSSSTQTNAKLSHNKKVIKSAIFSSRIGGIVGAIYVKK